jgi:hypothetical protein
MKIRVVLVSFLLPALTWAQSGVGLDFGFRSGPVRSPSMNQFIDSYNAAYSSILIEPYEGLGMTSGWSIGMDAGVSGAYGSLRFSNVSAKSEALYNAGGKRHFDLNQFITTVGFGTGVYQEAFDFHIGVGMAVGKDVIRSYYEYADGTTSIGKDKLLNGIYEGLHFSYLAEAELAVGLGGGFMVFTHFDYLFGSFAKIKFTLDEWHWDKSLDIYYVAPQGLPLDYNAWLAQQGAFTYPVEDYVKSDMNGLRFEIGLRYQLNF